MVYRINENSVHLDPQVKPSDQDAVPDHALSVQSIDSIPESEAIDQLEKRLALRLMLVHEAECASNCKPTAKAPETQCDHDGHLGYENQFQQLFQNVPEERIKQHLIDNAFSGSFRSTCFRSICWKIFLDILPAQVDGWDEAIHTNRDQFALIQTKYEADRLDCSNVPNKIKQHLENGNLNDNNPLSQQENSWWHQHFKNAELNTIIDQDVCRTFPEVDFFHQPHIQHLLRNLLFLYAKEHPEIEYKQGMHELLAPIVFVLHSDHQAFLYTKETDAYAQLDDKFTSKIEMQLAERFLEADAYKMFENLMEHVKCWYLPENDANKECEVQPFTEHQKVLKLSELGRNLNYINETLLKTFDLKLYQRLQALQIEPQIYGIRWLRLLFGREYPIEDLLVLWDAVFASNFQICNHIFTAMLIAIRTLLFEGDYLDAMNHLMRYPHVPDIGHVIQLALHMHDPDKYQRPTIERTSILPNAMHSTFSKRSNLKQINGTDCGEHLLKSKTSTRLLTLAHKLIHSKRNTRDRSYSSPGPGPSSFVANPFNKLRANTGTHSDSGRSSTESAAKEQGKQSQKEFCVHHLSKQIGVLQKALQQSRFKEASSECSLDDTLSIAIAELKQIRDVLDGSLLLEQLPTDHKQTQSI